ncbi:hypothetical protein Dimus_011724 [Dionaea muscipula]
MAWLGYINCLLLPFSSPDSPLFLEVNIAMACLALFCFSFMVFHLQFYTGMASRILLLQPSANAPPQQPLPNHPLPQQPLPNPLPQQPLTNPLLQPLSNPLLQPLTNPLLQPLSNPLLQPLTNPLTSPGNQFAECWNAIMRTPGCLGEIQGSLVSYRFAMSSNCCKAIVDVGANCWLMLSPLSAYISPLIKDQCTSLLGGGGGGTSTEPGRPAGFRGP